MKKIIRYLVFSTMLFCSGLAFAAPVAMVEDIDADTTSVGLLDFLEAGEVVELGDNGKLILGYLESCVRETIQGGKVTVGKTQSQVDAGKVDRATTQCDGGGLLLAANQAVQSGAMAFRDLGDIKPSLTVYDTSPMLLLPQGGRVVIKRVDEKGERHKLQVDKSSYRTKLDLAEIGIGLTPGANYMLSNGGKTMVFTVSEDAKSGGASDLIRRIVPL